MQGPPGPPHPGRVLHAIYLEDGPFDQTELALITGVSRSTINRIVQGTRDISAHIATQLAPALGTSPQYLIGLQAEWDVYQDRLRATDAKAARTTKVVVKRAPASGDKPTRSRPAQRIESQPQRRVGRRTREAGGQAG
mgnify:CR=1 FL=1